MKKVHADVQDSGGNCDQCGGSSSSNHLKQHMEIHACAHCKQTFEQRRRLAGKFHGSNMVDEEISKRN